MNEVDYKNDPAMNLSEKNIRRLHISSDVGIYESSFPVLFPDSFRMSVGEAKGGGVCGKLSSWSHRPAECRYDVLVFILLQSAMGVERGREKMNH